MKKLFFAMGLIGLIGFGVPLSAQVVISEIMYDVPGTDTGYEWIEVHNTGSVPVDISEWRLRENETEHYLSLESGDNPTLSVGGYAIIASDSAKFLTAQTEFTGLLFDSVFSLGNQGESLELISGDEVIDSVYYTPQEAANGTGASLQYVGSTWIAGVATPGKQNSNVSPTNVESSEASGVSNEINLNTSNMLPQPVQKKGPFKPYYIGTLSTDTVMLAGTPVSIDFEMLYYREENKDPITKHGGIFVWNMGDGSEFIQDWEKDFLYTYTYPGTYVIHIAYTRSPLAEEPDYVFQKNIVIDAAAVAIGFIDEQGGIRIDNNTGKKADMSHWKIVYGDSQYIFPKNTFIPSGEQRSIALAIHGFSSLDQKSKKNIALLRPSGEIHQEDVVNKIVEREYIKNNPPVLSDVEISQKETTQTPDDISIIEPQPKDMPSHMVLWGVGAGSILSLLLSLGVAIMIRSTKRESEKTLVTEIEALL